MSYISISEAEAKKNRNRMWEKNEQIPTWVDVNSVGLDQFFTVPSVASYCYQNLLSFMQKDGVESSQYNFIEPSAGDGVFFDLLPQDRRVGIDICPLRTDIIEHDFLSWRVKPNGRSHVVVGNPPFGYRAWLALVFMNHAATFADYVGMILPMAFQSDGKGSPKHRVRGLELLHSEYLPKDSFTDTLGRSVKINGLWQVWRRGINIQQKKKLCKTYIDLFTVDERKERLCGQERMTEANYFLQRTFFKDPPKLVKSFSKVKYVCGYGIIIKRHRQKITKLLNDTNWVDYSNLAAHNCRHISMYHIEKVLTDAGYIDD